MKQQRPGLLPGEKILVLEGRGVYRMPHLCGEDDAPLEFERKGDAVRAAARVNGIPYRGRYGWLIRFEIGGAA